MSDNDGRSLPDGDQPEDKPRNFNVNESVSFGEVEMDEVN